MLDDFDDIGERRIEAALDRMGFDGETIICPRCNKRSPAERFVMASADPYASPLHCDDCEQEEPQT